eukprot:g21631.t1
MKENGFGGGEEEIIKETHEQGVFSLIGGGGGDNPRGSSPSTGPTVASQDFLAKNVSLQRPQVILPEDQDFVKHLAQAAEHAMLTMEQKVQCRLCSKYFKSPDHVRKHLNRSHLDWVEAHRKELHQVMAEKAWSFYSAVSTCSDEASAPEHVFFPGRTSLVPSAAVYRPGFSQQYAPGAPHLPAMQAPVPPAGARGRSTSPQPGSPPSPTLPLMARTGPQATPPAEVDFRPGVSFGNTSYMQYAPEVENGFTDAELRAIYGKLDKNRNGIVSKLELIAAVSQEKSIADMLGIDGESLLSDEKSFDELHSLFEEISAGKKGIDFEAFAKHVRKACAERTPRSNRMLEIFNLIDADNSGSISKLELVAAMQNNPSVDEFLMPGVDSSRIMDDENLFEKIDGLFEVTDVASALQLLSFNLDTPLSRRGERQLQDMKDPKISSPLQQEQLQTASFLQEASPELLVFSPLQRAKRTAEVLFGEEVPKEARESLAAKL